MTWMEVGAVTFAIRSPLPFYPSRPSYGPYRLVLIQSIYSLNTRRLFHHDENYFVSCCGCIIRIRVCSSGKTIVWVSDEMKGGCVIY